VSVRLSVRKVYCDKTGIRMPFGMVSGVGGLSNSLSDDLGKRGGT